MASTKSSRVNPKYKTKYRVGNWPAYERGLRARGDVTVWFAEEALSTWTPPPTRCRGGQQRYSDPADPDGADPAHALPPAASAD